MPSLLTKFLVTSRLLRPTGTHATATLAPAAPAVPPACRAPPLDAVDLRRPLNTPAHQPRLRRAL